MGQVKKSKDLLEVLKELINKDKLERQGEDLQGKEKGLISIEKETKDTKNLLKRFIEDLNPRKDTLDDLSQEMDYIKKAWEEQKKRDFPSLSYRSIETKIFGAIKNNSKDIWEKIEAMSRVFAHLKILKEICRRLNERKSKLEILMNKEVFTEDDISKLKKVKHDIDFLMEESKRLGTDQRLIGFLEKAMSPTGVPFEELSKEIVFMLEKHDLKKLLTLHLVVQSS